MPVEKDVVWTEIELEVQERYSLDDEQLAWRRWCIRNNCSGNIDTFKQEYPACADEAFLTSGSAVFDNEIVIKRRGEVTEPIKRGEFEFMNDGLAITDIVFVEKQNGPVSIYQGVKPQYPYVIGDAGEGSDLYRPGDKRVGGIGINMTKIYTRKCIPGKYYNDALIGIETNYSTFPNKEASASALSETV